MSNSIIRLLFLCFTSFISCMSLASDNRYIGGVPISIDQNITFNFNIANQGSQRATAWYNDDIAVVVEGADSSVFERATMEKIVALMLNSKRSFEDFTEIRNLPLNGHYKSIPTIQVPRDNNGAGGLAGHGTFGISVGRGFFDRFYERVKAGNISIDQVWLYEMNRNFYKPGATGWNGWIDWAMDGQDFNYGFWTVGFNNAAAIWIVDDLNVGLNYHGSNRDQFRAGFDSDLNTYLNNSNYNFDNVWTSRLFPWRHQTINNLMSGVLLRWYDNLGGKPFIQRLYREIENNPKLANRFDFQRARDNWYRMVSRASRTNQENFFESTLRWNISQGAKNTIRSEFPNNTSDLVIEAENAQLFGQMKKGNDSKASGGQFIYTENQSRYFDENNTQHRAEFIVNISQNGRYLLKGAVYADNGGDDSLWIKINNGQRHLWDTTVNTTYDEIDVNSRGVTNQLIVDLRNGNNNITIYAREDGCRLDKLRLIRVGD